jgi:hypothetical protein
MHMSGILENRPPKTTSDEGSVGMQQQHGDDKIIKRIPIAVKTKVMFFWIASMQYELRKQCLLYKNLMLSVFLFLKNLLINLYGMVLLLHLSMSRNRQLSYLIFIL